MSPQRKETDAVSVEIRADPVQHGDSVKVGLGIKNDGNTRTRLHNPFELSQFLVVDRAGFPKKVPRSAPRLMVNTKGRPEPQLRTSFPVVHMQHNGVDGEISALDEQSLDFEPGDSYTAWFAIDRFVADEEAGTAAGEVPVAADEYGIRCVVTLISAGDPKDSRVVETPRVNVRLLD
jgi:hypothetical protein